MQNENNSEKMSERKIKAEAILGSFVTVTVDRPIGSVHPKHKDILYPINYGYINGVIGGDGEEQDAYIIGINKPVSNFSGKVIAVILRENDSEDKWVVAPENSIYNQAEIMAAVEFQEKYFKTEIICLYEKSCGAIIYRNSGSETEYLLLFQHKSQTWSFPKGHCEPLEIEEQTACREVFEETGMKVAIKQGFYESVSYPIREKATKYVHLYIAKATGDIEIWRDEIEKYIWANKSESIKLLPKVGYDELLNKAEMFLQNNE